ncbi:tetratricopeptide repeat protein [Streptosporangium amethystogenes]|uniref:tetratricopeptide repeat protein n=1 Tax=Streptosporangium amethystogenes TaxID=2002 RepID=UPI00068A1B89|nr:tetratricopeptide repeat protein [Streptosporangium amethystogenes]
MSADFSDRNQRSEGHVNELGGTVLGPVVQARDVHGGIHLHQASIPLPKPTQLPAGSILVNRSEALALLDVIGSGRGGTGVPNVAVVSGPAGIGKTAVALHWSHRERGGFPDGQLFADLRGHAADAPVQPVEVLGRFIRAFGIAPERIPGGLAERSALYQSLVSERRLVVVLDDALSAAQVSPLLPASANSVAIVTSRWRLAGLLVRGARGVQLDQLSADAALTLLQRIVGDDRVQREPDAAGELVELCARLPLALCVAAARLATRPHWSLSEMVEALTHERQRLSALSVEDDMTIQAALTLSYHGLSPPEAARLYRLLGLFPGTTFDSWAAAATVLLPRAQVRRLLEVLTDANLLDDVPGGSYRFHDLTRLHARGLAEQQEPEATRDQTVRRALDWFLYTASTASQVAMPYRRVLCQAVVYEPAEPLVFADSVQALDWFEYEFGNLRAAGRAAFERGLFATTWQLVDALWPLFLYRGHHAERLEVDMLGLAAARACSDSRAEAKMLNRTGLALRTLGRLDEAADDFRGALEIWRRAGNRQRMAGSRRRLGLVEMDRGHVDEAIVLFEEALGDYRAAGEPRKAALTLCDLGNALIEVEHVEEAVAYLVEARRLLAPEADRYNQARVLILLGRARAGGPTATIGLLAQGLEEMRRIGSDTGEAQALQALGDLALESHGRDEARRLYEEAERILARRGARSRQLDDRLSRLDST